MGKEFTVIGKRMPDVAGIEKATGAAQFISDIRLPGMLIGKVLRSPYSHARIVRIDTSKAEALAGVEAVVTVKDAPKKKYSGNIINFLGYPDIEFFGAYDSRILDEKVRYVGDAVAAVAAVNEKIAEEALDLIDVKYERLPAVFDEIEAMKEGAPRIHDFVERRQADGKPGKETVEKNIGVHVMNFPLGDVEKGFQEADHIIEATGYTSQQRQATIETFQCIASFDADGRLTLWSPTQLSNLTQRAVSYIFDIPVGKIRIINKFIGGTFGAGCCMLKEPLCILLAKKSGKPVKLNYTRQEEFSDRPTRSCFGPYTIKMGVKQDGTITAMERKVISTAGAHVEYAGLTALIATSSANALYRRPNFYAEIDAVYTNKVPCGAMRGFGNPEETFVREQVMDMAAERLGIDPLEFRLKNLCQLGDPGIFGPNFPITSNGMADCIKLGAGKMGWSKKRGRAKRGAYRRGVGVSCMAHNTGAYPAHAHTTCALIKFNEDGTIILTISPAATGTNAFTSLAQVAAEVLGLSFEDVRVIWGDTDVTLWEKGTFGSSTMYIAGKAVQQAASEARDKLLLRAAKKLGVTTDKLGIKKKRIYVKANPEKNISIAEITKEAIYNLGIVEQITGSCSFQPGTSPPSYQAAFSEVEVDTETGQVNIVKMVLVNDSGLAVNPMIVEGQIEGGVVQGLGYSLWEEPVMDSATGRILTDDFDTYKIPTSMDLPELETVLLEQPEPTGPFGAKGAGEPGSVNMAASIANAIYDAIKIRMWHLPITPEKILDGLRLGAEAKQK